MKLVVARRPEKAKQMEQSAIAAARDAARAARFAAFQVETDPLIGKVLCGEISLETYAARRQAIRDRFPYEKEA